MANEVFIKGLEPLLKKMQAYSVDIQNEVDGELNTSAKNIRDNAKRLAPVDEGLLRGQIAADTNQRFIKKVVAGAFYSPYVEFGTKKYVKVPTGLESYAASFKGKAGRGSFEQFVDSIEAWMKRKGIKATDGRVKKATVKGTTAAAAQRSLAYAIALKIYRNGIKPKPFLFPAMDVETPLLIERLKKIMTI